MDALLLVYRKNSKEVKLNKQVLLKSDPILFAIHKQKEKERCAQYYACKKALLQSDPILFTKHKQKQKEAYARYRAKKALKKGENNNENLPYN